MPQVSLRHVICAQSTCCFLVEVAAHERAVLSGRYHALSLDSDAARPTCDVTFHVLWCTRTNFAFHCANRPLYDLVRPDIRSVRCWCDTELGILTTDCPRFPIFVYRIIARVQPGRQSCGAQRCWRLNTVRFIIPSAARTPSSFLLSDLQLHATVCLPRAGQPRCAGDAAKSGQFMGQFTCVTGDTMSVKGLYSTIDEVFV